MRLIIFSLICLTFGFSAGHEVEQLEQGRIIGGVEAGEVEFPYTVAIWTYTDVARYFCGGAVIDRQLILTAGHCVQDAVFSTIQLGSVSLSNQTAIGRQVINATSFYLHPNFDPLTLVGNVGLIYLDEPLRYSDYVNVISLPTAVLPGSLTLTSVGWGQIDDENSGPVDTLRKVEVVSLLNDHCQNFYGDQIVDSMLCAIGSFNEGTCIGDIGSPLIQIVDDVAVHVGTASFLSSNGCESYNPSGYERTFSYVEWIAAVSAQLNLK